ncbi:MAG: type VI secretion system tube protein TssD [Candidatus Limimorpha sp.]
MALNATLTVENHSYTVMECEYEFTQAVDITGRPSDSPRGGLINVVIAAPDDSDLALHEWMFDKNKILDGKIVFTVNRDNIDRPKTLAFVDAYCVRLYEYYNNNNSVQMYLKLSIMAGKMVFGSNNTCEFQMII